MRLLVIEDEDDLRAALVTTLAEEGYAVDGAMDGEEGLYMALETDYDAVILDIMLPKLDGWTLLERLRRKKKTPVLILTARDQLADRVRGLDLGSDDFVAKPFEMPELLARLRALIRRSVDLATPIIRLGGVILNTATRTAKYKGHPTDLTPREYSLLEYMLMHRGQLVTRTELYEHLFDENDDSLSNVLDVHVCNVRRKTSASLIKTRRGEGYITEG